jgi:hypothetical protein
MAAPFLSQLGLSEEEHRKLAAIGAASPAMLLGTYHASMDAFERLLGRDRAREIAAKLGEMVSAEDRERLASPAPRFPTGARPGKPPKS